MEFITRIGNNIKAAVSRSGLLNSGLFMAGGAVVGGLLGGFEPGAMIIGAASGFVATALTGVRVINRGENTPDAPAPGAGIRPPTAGAPAAGLGMPGEEPNPGLPSGLAGAGRQPTPGQGR